MPTNATDAPPTRCGRVAMPAAVIEPVRRPAGVATSQTATAAKPRVFHNRLGCGRVRLLNTYAAGCKFVPVDRIL